MQWIAGVTPRAWRGRAIGTMVTAGYAGTSASYLMVVWVLSAGLSWRVGYALLSMSGMVGAGLAWFTFRGVPVQFERVARVNHSTVDRVGWREVGGARLGLVIAGYAVHTAELFVARFWVPHALIAVLAPAALSTGGATAYVLAGILFAAGVPSPFVGGWVGDRYGLAGSLLLFAVKEDMPPANELQSTRTTGPQQPSACAAGPAAARHAGRKFTPHRHRENATSEAMERDH